MEVAFRMKFFPVVLWAWVLSSLRLSVMSCTVVCWGTVIILVVANGGSYPRGVAPPGNRQGGELRAQGA